MFLLACGRKVSKAILKRWSCGRADDLAPNFESAL